VIHVVTSPADGEVQIPQVLKGEPAASATELGSKNYSSTPLAVLLGATFGQEAILGPMRKAAKDAGAPEVPWLRVDTTKPAPPLGPEYGKVLVARIKMLLGEMQKEGTLKVGTEGVFWY
jgi:hypothetical protein